MDSKQVEPVITPRTSGTEYTRRQERPNGMEYCKFCAALIPFDAVVCTACGRQVEELRRAAPAQTQTVNVYSAPLQYNAPVYKQAKNKWIAFLLCLFLGFAGGHKFYEGRIGAGILYLFTAGLFGIGWLFDTIALLLKPNPYYV